MTRIILLPVLLVAIAVPACAAGSGAGAGGSGHQNAMNSGLPPGEPGPPGSVNNRRQTAPGPAPAPASPAPATVPPESR